MHGKDVERVVDLQLATDDIHSDIAAETAGKAEDQATRHTDKAGGGGHGCKARHHTGDNADQRWTPKAHPFNAHPDKRGRSRRDMGDKQRHAGTAARTKRRTTIETEPADPQHTGTNHGQRRAMRRDLALREMAALANHNRADKRSRAGSGMHHNAASEIHHAPGGHNAAAPDPMGDRRIDEEQPQRREDQHGREFHPFDIGTDDQRRGDNGKGHLEGGEQRFRNGARHAVDADAAKEHIVKIAEPGSIAGKGKRIAGNNPQHRHQTGDGKMMHQHRYNIF